MLYEQWGLLNRSKASFLQNCLMRDMATKKIGVIKLSSDLSVRHHKKMVYRNREKGRGLAFPWKSDDSDLLGDHSPHKAAL